MDVVLTRASHACVCTLLLDYTLSFTTADKLSPNCRVVLIILSDQRGRALTIPDNVIVGKRKKKPVALWSVPHRAL